MWKRPETYLRLWERWSAEDPELTLAQFALIQAVPLEVMQNRMDDAREARKKRTVIQQAGAVATMAFDAPEGFEQWFLLQSDNHHDSVQCNRDLEEEHLEAALRRHAVVMIFGDVLDAMQGRFDPRRSMDELRPEYRREDYYDFVVYDCAKWYGRYVEQIGLMTDGNHELSVLKNANTDLLGRLVGVLNERGGKIVRGGYGGWVRLVFTLEEGRQVVKRIKYFHGAGGEAPVTRGVIQTNRQAVYLPDADVVINGHSHNHYHVPISRERLTEEGRHYFDLQHHIRIPGYKQGYGSGVSGWEVTRGGVPKPIGAVWMHLVRRGNDIAIQFESDIRGAAPVEDVGEIFSGKALYQDV